MRIRYRGKRHPFPWGVYWRTELLVRVHHEPLGSLLSGDFSFLGHTQCSSVFALSGLFKQGKR